MHDSWFNEGAPVPAGTTFPLVGSNSSTLDPESLNVIINPAVSLITIEDFYGRPVPPTTTIKFLLTPEPAYIREIQNTSDFSTYTAPFTVNSVFPNANSYLFIYIAARAFDTVTGAGQQCKVVEFQTRVQPQG
jgi:hypothetical protein